MKELIAAERECSQKLARLSNLAERVILTKRSWGYPTKEVEELVQLVAFVESSGSVTYRASPTTDE